MRHPNTGVGTAEHILGTALLEWRQELSAGADLNNTTLRKRFSSSVFKHGQRQPEASKPWLGECGYSSRRRWVDKFVARCSAWRKAERAQKNRGQANKEARKTRNEKTQKQIKAKTGAYCALFLQLHPNELVPNLSPARLTWPPCGMLQFCSVQRSGLSCCRRIHSIVYITL